MYKYFVVDSPLGLKRHLVRIHDDGRLVWFADDDTVDCLEHHAYLEWVAEGNTPEEWSPDAS
jgi:hypothetical protein